ncbi:CxC2 domain-containing protein [Mycena kentingensis (nom. inval.)]|nr:CxC2 domain-containing protein [Mycena kentingensis (nom. inval.)]
MSGRAYGGGRPRRELDFSAGSHVDGFVRVAQRGIYLGLTGSKRQRLTTATYEKKTLSPTDLGDLFAAWKPMPYSGFLSADAEEPEADAPEPASGTSKRKQSESTINPMAQWRPLMSTFLEEVLRHEGDPSSTRLFRCEQCGEWNGRYWIRQTLARLGLVYQLGHAGFPCPLPHPTVYEMTVIDVPLVSTVHIRYCSCNPNADDERYHQLLRNKWYPATVAAPATCATFRTLQAFRLLNVVGNLNVTDFITSLERMTDTISFSGLTALQSRNRQFQRMSRQWAFLSRLKRTGRAHVAGDLQQTPLGACAVRCWACPQEDRNLPPDWRLADPKYRFLYMLILTVDANFRLKNRLRANEISDTPLGPGWAYWVEPKAYNEHVKNYVSETDMSTCIAFAALLQKNTRMTTGLRVSGVGGCVCARHEIVRPNGLGDLQKGERYSNMDWIVFSAILGVCLPSRDDIKDLDQITVQFGLPVFHADSHEVQCRDEQKLDIQPGVGGTDGEGIERVWSGLNPASFSTKEMSLSNRADALDDRIDNHNHLKNLGLGHLLQRRLVLALAERQRQIDAFEAVSEGIHPDTIKAWKCALRQWEQDHSKPNPFVLKSSPYRSEAEIRLELQKEEREQHGTSGAPLAGASATSFLVAGIQIEDLQSRITDEASRPSLLSTSRESQVEEWRLAVLRKLARFRELQAVYMPGAAACLLAAEEARNPDLPAPGPEETDAIEERLRVTACENAIVLLRASLFTKQWLIAYRNAHAVGQKQTTKSANLIQTMTERAHREKRRYHRSYAALAALGVLHRYKHLHQLKDSDLALPGDTNTDADEIDARNKLNSIGARHNARTVRSRPSGQSRQVMSWIWTAGPTLVEGSAEDELHDSIRVDWTRALARKTRWCEEVMLLQEEMRRVLRYLRWQANWWIAHGPIRRASAAFCELLLGHLQAKWAVEASRTLEEMQNMDGMAELEAAHEAEQQAAVVS